MRSMLMNLGTTKALRAASGNLAARRGSTLILVVATLALLAVLTVAYVSIGGGDRRSATVTTRAAAVDRQAEQVADYLVGIVGDDALSVYFQGFDPGNQPVFFTEAIDLPRTDPNRTFDGTPAPRATPEPQDNYFGLQFTPSGSLPPLDPEQHDASDPASDLFQNNGFLAPFGPSDPFLAASEPTYIREAGGAFQDPAYLDRRDWSKISNVSPNGLYVNLFNLRGNFDAQPGISSGEMSDASTMWLNDAAGLPTRDLAYGQPARVEVPADYDSMLLGSYLPMNFDNGAGVGDSQYLPYMWADADGDGYTDSRWQELVDVTGAGGPQAVIANEGQFRWFVAARIIDLSGRVNVNTARGLLQFEPGGLAGAPTNAHRLGASPADIDLRRLLVLEPQVGIFGEFYDAIPNPSGGTEDYSDYSDFATAQGVGEEGFWGTRRALGGEQISPGILPRLDAQTARERASEYSNLRYPGPVAVRRAGQGTYQQFSFGTEDLRDLLTYEGLNDPGSLSNLERAAGGRSAVAPQAFSPLRENRSLRWERVLPETPADTGPLALRHTSVRRQLTTLSGGILRVPTQVRYATTMPTGLDVFASISRLPGNQIALDPREEDPTVLQDGYTLLTLAAPQDLSTMPADEREQRRLRNAHPLFRTYAKALAPAADEAGAWDVAPSANPQWATTFYARDPLFALRSAAHLTANMVDMFDADDIPSAYTVLFNNVDRSDIENLPALTEAFPWWTMLEPAPATDAGIGGRLDLGEGRLPANATESLGVTAMNVYGLEVHPFITQASVYNVYSDSDEGDFEGPPPGGGGPGGVFSGSSGSFFITMNFTSDSSNVDYIGQIFAVQLSNPYTTDIVVRDGQYFVRFGNLGGDAATPVPLGVEVPAGTTIPAGESVVVYIETPNFVSRAQAAAPSFEPVSSEAIQDWINSHLSEDPTAADAIRFDGAANIDDFLASTPGDTGPDSFANRQVTLWTPLYSTGTNGDITSFVMLDKMFDPARDTDRPTLDRRPPEVNIRVDGATWADDTMGAPSPDNTGYSLVTWGTIARPTGAAPAPLGALPAYVLEKPFLDDGTSLNEAETDGWDLPTPPSAVFTLSKGGDFDPPAAPAARRPAAVTLDDLFASTQGSGSGGSIATDILLEASDISHSLRQQIAEDGGRWYVNPLRNDNRGTLDAPGDQVPVLRPGDFLGVPAVGPVQMPAVDNGTITPEELDWFTTGELLTLALGFDAAPAVNAPVWYPSLPADTSVLLDRGHLSLDLPAPFVDNNTNGTFDSDVDDRRGLGVPHAMAVLSNITTLQIPEVSPRSPVAGLVNLNTATEAVMSVLPGLTPTFESNFDPDFTWIRDGGTLLHDQRSDVGAGVRSYRDKSAARPRLNPAATAVPFFEPAAWGDLDPFDLEGRQTTTAIEALREHPGMASVGELLAVHQPPAGGGGGLGGASYAQPHLLRRLGNDNLSLPVDGVDAVRYGPDGEVSLVAGTRDDGIPDDFDEQLALYNGVANTVTVRSDVYAIWFVLHGYAREDVEGLRPDDPMTPSVARRYLVVVDRSNVRRAGDRPRVLLFDELPL